MDLDDPLQRYYVMEPIGSGGQGHTFRGIDRATDREVAIKVLSLRDVDKWKSFDLFEREIAILKSLDHPGIPKYIDNYASETTGDYFLVMTLVEGKSLRDRLQNHKPLKPRELRRVFDQALDILEYLHGLTPPVIHRDIKPANLVLDRKGKLYLVDFGGVRLAARPDGGSTVIGTFGYMAPEQLHGDATPATDIYSLGATVAALHSGMEADALPHDGLRLDVTQLGFGDRLRELLSGMLEPDPKDRIQSVAGVRRVLRSGREPSPSKDTALARTARSAEEERALVKNIPMGLRALARVPAPFSILVWILTGLGAGVLTVFEVLILPLIYRLSLGRSRPGPQGAMDSKRADAKRELDEFKGRVRMARRSLSYVAGRTHPISEDRALPPGGD